MSPNKNTTNRYLVWIFIFICGFVTGVAVTVYKLQPQLDAQNQATAPATTSPSPSVDHQRMHSLEDIVAKNPDDLAAWTELSHLYFDSNQHQKAIKGYKRTLELSPNDPNLWTDLGIMYRRDEQPQKAIECFNQAIAIAPMHQPSRFNKGIVALYDLNDLETAIASFEDLLTINPDAKANGGQSITEFVEMLKKEQKQEK